VEHSGLILTLGVVALIGMTGNLAIGLRGGLYATGGRPGLVGGAPRQPDGAAHDPQAAPPTSEESWRRRLTAEQVRFERDGRPATVLVLDLGGSPGPIARRTSLRRLGPAGLPGHVAGLVRAADVVRSGMDGSAWVLLTETDEAGAEAFARWVAETLRHPGVDSGFGSALTAGWAAMAEHRDVRSAERLAEARLRGARDGWIRSAAARTAPGCRPSPRRAVTKAALAGRRAADHSEGSRTSPSRMA
jgi:hypothetical protein